MTFGWYYEEGTVQGDGDDAWSLIDEAVKQAADDERLHYASAWRRGETATHTGD
jgi:hypothetical protein